MKRKELFSVADTPYKGLVSDRHPLALKPGEALDAINLRCEVGGAVRVRDGIAQELDTAGLPSGATFFGTSGLVKVQEGVWLIYLAAKDPADGKVHIYNRRHTTASGWGSQWYELTQSSGAFGDTRLAPPTNGLVSFTALDSDAEVRNHLTYLGSTDSQGPAVVVQNGVDRPLHIVGFPLAATTANRAVPIVPIVAPSLARSTVAEAGVYGSLPVRSGSVTAAATASGTFTAATGGHVQQSGVAGEYLWEWQTGTTVAVGDTGDVVMDSDTVSLLGPDKTVAQIGMIVEAEDESWWDGVKVWAHVSRDGGAYGWELLHDPTASDASAKNNRALVETNSDGVVVLAFAYKRLTTGESFSIEMNGLRLEVASDRLSPSTMFKVRWIYASGWVPGGAEYVVARKAALSEAESGGVVVISGAQSRTVDVRSLGASVEAGFEFPLDENLSYVYRVPVVNPTLQELEDSFTDTWSIYRRDQADTDYQLTENIQVGEWSGGAWTLSINPNEGDVFLWSDIVSPEDKNPRRRAPHRYTDVTPIGQCSAYANKRQYVGAAISDSSGTNTIGNVVAISEEGYPGRFRSLVRFDGVDDDAASGYEARLGVEDVKALVVAEGLSDSSRVVCLTDRSVFAIERASSERLFNVRRLVPIGAATRHTNAVSDSGLFWLDDQRSLRLLGRSEDLSSSKVQMRLDAIADVGSVRLAVHRGRLYVADGETVLTYSLVAQHWESSDVLPSGKGVGQFFNWEEDLMFFAPDCILYRHEAPGQATDDGEDIPWALESGAHHNGMFSPIAANRVGVVASVAPTALTTKRLFSEPAATVTGEIDLDTGGSLAWKYDQLPGGGVPGGEGQAVRVRVEGEFSTAFELVALTVELADVPLGGAVV